MTARELDRYRRGLQSSASRARAYVLARIRAEGRGLGVAEERELAMEVISDAVGVYGDQAQALAADLFDGVMEADGEEARAEVFEGLVDEAAASRRVRYAARKLVEGDEAGFEADAADLAEYYVKRCAWDNLVRNCDANRVMWARVPTGEDTCAWCLMLASRGFAYHGQDNAGHKHRGCDCVVVPGNRGSTVEGYDPDELYDLWKASEEIEADEALSRSERKAARRALIAEELDRRHAAPPSFTVARDADVYSPISDKHVGDVERMLQEGDYDCQRLWARFEGEFKQPEFGAQRNQYVQTRGVVTFTEEGDLFELSKKGYGDTWFHEFGHNIDHLLASERWGYYSYEWRGGEFQAAIRSEALEHVRSVDVRAGVRSVLESGDRERILRFCRGSGALSDDDARALVRGDISVDQAMARANLRGGRSRAAAYALVSNELRGLPDLEAHAVSDMFEGATGGKVNGGWGHREQYWDENGDKARSTEAFAEMFAASVSSPVALAAIRRYFPRSYGLFREMVREALG